MKFLQKKIALSYNPCALFFTCLRHLDIGKAFIFSIFRQRRYSLLKFSYCLKKSLFLPPAMYNLTNAAYIQKGRLSSSQTVILLIPNMSWIFVTGGCTNGSSKITTLSDLIPFSANFLVDFPEPNGQLET